MMGEEWPPCMKGEKCWKTARENIETQDTGKEKKEVSAGKELVMSISYVRLCS